eukprot:COSAG05_NODE_23351_length_258_cov_1.295597_1_plen_30_part_10
MGGYSRLKSLRPRHQELRTSEKGKVRNTEK